MPEKENHILFFTATIVGWISVLSNDRYKDIIMKSLRFLVRSNRIDLYGFVIMPNHIHLLWRMKNGNRLKDVQRDFLKFTAQQIKFDLLKTNQVLLADFITIRKDRQFQFWQRKSLSVRIYNRKVFEQKLNYIHMNPLQKRWRLVKTPEDYKYSSARYYILNMDEWGFITHYFEHLI